MAGDHEYVKRRSFETGTVDDWSVAEDRVALLSGSTVYLVGDEDDRIELDEPGEYVALNDKLFVFTGGGLEAYGISGTRLWSAALDGVDGLAAPEDSDVIVVLTGDDSLVGLDAAAGHERFAHDRPDADVATTPQIVCADQSLVIAAWSFLSILSPEGETELRTTLDGAIHGVGVVDDTVVCVMKDDRLLGIDAASGDQQWCHDWEVDRIDPFGRDELLVQTSDGVRAVTPTGEWSSLDLDDGVPVAAASGEPVCVLLDSLVNVYGRAAPGDAPVEASVTADVVEPTAGSVPVDVENVGDAMTVTTVEVAASGATVATGPERLTLDPSETERVSLRLADVDSEAVDLTVHVDGDPASTATLPVAGGMSALDVSASPAAVDDDGWLVDVAVENEAAVPISGVELAPSGRARDVLGPGTEWTVTVPLPEAEPLVVATPDTERQLEVSTPDAPLDVDVRFDDGVVVVDVANGSSVDVTDTIELTSDAFPRAFELAFDGAPGSRLVAAVLPVESGDVAVSVESRHLSRTESVQVPAEAAVGVSTPTTGAGDRSGSQAADGQSRRAATSGRSDGESASVDRIAENSGSAAAATGGTPTDAAESAARDSTSEESSALELDRRLDPEHPSLGELVFEYVDVTNRGAEPREVTVRSADDAVVTAVVPSNDSESFVRAHSLTASEVEVPSVSVDDDAKRRRAPSVEPPVQRPDWYCLATVAGTAAGSQLHLEFVNESRTRVSVSNLSLRSLSFASRPDSFEAGPRTTETRTFPLSDEPTGDDPGLLSFDAGSDVASSTEYQTLVHVPDSSQSGLADVNLRVDEETIMEETGGTVVLHVRNDGPVPVEGFTMEADSDQVQTMLYDSLAVESLAPGESVKHYIDVGDVADGLEVPVELGTADGVTEAVSVVADAPREGAIQVERPNLADPGDEAVSVPDRISTGFEVADAE